MFLSCSIKRLSRKKVLFKVFLKENVYIRLLFYFDKRKIVINGIKIFYRDQCLKEIKRKYVYKFDGSLIVFLERVVRNVLKGLNPSLRLIVY